MATHESALQAIMFYTGSFWTPPLVVTERNSIELCHVFGSEPDMKMSAQNLRVLPAPKIWRPKLPFRVFLRRYHDLSANVFGAKCTIDRQEKVSIYEESPSISSKLGELWPKNGKLLMFARLLQFPHGAQGCHRIAIALRCYTSLSRILCMHACV